MSVKISCSVSWAPPPPVSTQRLRASHATDRRETRRHRHHASVSEHASGVGAHACVPRRARR
eukprot:1241007-Rhodomonas_salina.1